MLHHLILVMYRLPILISLSQKIDAPLLLQVIDAVTLCRPAFLGKQTIRKDNIWKRPLTPTRSLLPICFSIIGSQLYLHSLSDLVSAGFWRPNRPLENACHILSVSWREWEPLDTISRCLLGDTASFHPRRSPALRPGGAPCFIPAARRSHSPVRCPGAKIVQVCEGSFPICHGFKIVVYSRL